MNNMVQVIENNTPALVQKIGAVLPKHIDPERIISIARNEVIQNPELNKCSPQSFLNAVVRCASLGLESGLTQQAYLIPFGKGDTKECNLIVGYKGLIELAYRSGKVKKIASRAVYENDKFEYTFGLEESLIHIPAASDRGQLICCYAVCHFVGGGSHFEVMNLTELLQIRDRAKGSKFGPWVTDFDAMCRKTAIRRLLSSGAVPTSVECSTACQVDVNTEIGISAPIIDIDLEPVQDKKPSDVLLEKIVEQPS